jgi:hypothetical protein
MAQIRGHNLDEWRAVGAIPNGSEPVDGDQTPSIRSTDLSTDPDHQQSSPLGNDLSTTTKNRSIMLRLCGR